MAADRENNMDRKVGGYMAPTKEATHRCYAMLVFIEKVLKVGGYVGASGRLFARCVVGFRVIRTVA